jgi:hypothetical protein
MTCAWGRSQSALPARCNQRVSGSCSFWNARGPLEDHAGTSRCRSSRRGLLRHLASPPPDSGTFCIRWRSPSTTRLRLRRRLPARTGAVQVDTGVAGAVRVPALAAPPLTASARDPKRGLAGGAHVDSYLQKLGWWDLPDPPAIGAHLQASQPGCSVAGDLTQPESDQ